MATIQPTSLVTRNVSVWQRSSDNLVRRNCVNNKLSINSMEVLRLIMGLHRVDFSSPARTRTPRRSAHYYAQVARTHDIDAHYDFVDETDSVVSSILALAGAVEVGGVLDFPPGFKFGAATAAYQVEGAWNVSDKGESIWDHLTHTKPDFTVDRSNGDVACDSYHRLQEDLQLIEDLGLDFYRFSIAWPRLLPSGFADAVSEDGHLYYTALIDGLRARGVEPVVTLYHWDLPQSLQDLGGWTNPLIVDWFADYARVVFSLFAGQVKTWITINEPLSMCDCGYRRVLAPDFDDPYVGALLCSKYILLAHAKAYRIYEKEFKPIYGGEVSLANHEFWYEPDTDQDWDITLLARDYAFGRYTHPIYSAEGGWPPALEKYIADKSKEEGYPRSRLPAFSPEEIELLKGSYDFFALNHYTSRTVRPARPGEDIGAFLAYGIEEVGAVLGTRPHWTSATSTSDWLKVNPEGLRNNLRLIKQQYGNVSIMITENGFSDSGESLNDAERVLYYQEYLKQVLLAITEDGVDVVGYTAWSLLDNFEWGSGYTSRFGLHAVDFSDPLRARTPKASARYYEQVVRARSLDVTDNPIQLDKGKSIWDHLMHTKPDFTVDRSNGDVACDSYHRWQEDLQLIEDLGLDFYRFSIAWPRLLPSGFTNAVSEDGRRYYAALIDGLRARGVEPVVTLYHWELPQSLQDLGGWTNPLIVDWFADYARVVFPLFSSQVKTWITINEPISMCNGGYRRMIAPDFDDPYIGALLCSKYILLAHAKAYRIYEKEFKPIYGGQVSLANQEFWFEPNTDQDWDITLLARDYTFGRYTHPIYSAEGGWPPALEKYIADKSKEEGYPRSRLPAFSPEEIELFKGSYDFFALNHYTSRTVSPARPREDIGAFLAYGIEEVGAVMGFRPHWKSATSTSDWLKINPEGLRDNLRTIKQQYGNVSIMITENGFSDSGESLNDAVRVLYYQEYLKQVLLAITEDGVDVVGYTAWSLLDNFEWGWGYTSRFGLHAVDFSNPLRARTPKASARYYEQVVRARSLDAHVSDNHETVNNSVHPYSRNAHSVKRAHKHDL